MYLPLKSNQSSQVSYIYLLKNSNEKVAWNWYGAQKNFARDKILSAYPNSKFCIRAWALSELGVDES